MMLRFLCLFSFVCFLASSAEAQSNLDSRVNENRPILIQIENQTSFDENLLLLKRPKLWTAYALPSVQFTDNAFYAQDDAQDDTIRSIATGLNFNLNPQNNFSFQAGIGISKYYYDDFNELDYDLVQANFSTDYDWGKYLFSANYTPAFVFEQDFDTLSLSLHRLSASVSRAYIFWNRLLITPVTEVSYVFADPRDFSYRQLESGLSAAYPISKYLLASLSARGYTKQYDDFFENITDEERIDSGARLNANLSYKINDNIKFSAQASFTTNHSNIEGNSYEVNSFIPSLQFTYRF